MSNENSGYAEYPRPGGGSGPALFGRGPGVYFDTIGESFNLVKQDLGQWIAATIVYFAIGIAVSLPVSMAFQAFVPRNPTTSGEMSLFYGAFALQLAINLFVVAIQGCLFVGMVLMGVRKSRGEYINVGMIFEPLKRFGSVFGSSLLYYLIFYVSLLALILPWFYFAPVLLMMPVVAFMKGTGPVDALKTTFHACKPHWVGLFGLCFVLWLLLVLGGCACLVGTLITWPMVCVVLGIHYRAFFESDSTSIAAAPSW